MVKTYTLPACEKETVDKAIERFRKKASAYGNVFSAVSGSPYATKRCIYAEDSITHTVTKIGTELVEVYDLTLDCDVIRKDGYTVAAKIEHLENGNFVRSFVEWSNPAWQTMKPYCQHCHTKHYRKNTFIVRKDDGSEVQVGSTCLLDYCGVDPHYFIVLKELQDLILKDSIDHYDFANSPKAKAVYDIKTAIALAMRIYKKQGYRQSMESGSNKAALWDALTENAEPSEEEMHFADEMIETVSVLSIDEQEDARARSYMRKEWLCNTIRPLAANGYCKDSHLGYIAYSPIAYMKYKEALAVEMERERERLHMAETSEYIGKVGDRVSIDVCSMQLITSWENDWGYTYLYKIIDKFGNVIIWYASRTIKSAVKLLATVKGHEERNGIRQTIVTRCRAC